MPKINETERQTQDRILRLFCGTENLGYEYTGNLQHTINTNNGNRKNFAKMGKNHRADTFKLANKIYDNPLGLLQYNNRKNMA